MTQATAENLIQFIKECEKIHQKDFPHKDIRLYYRGEEKEYGNSKCLPSIFRGDIDEKDNYYSSLRRHPDEFRDLSNLDVLSKMQHYRIKTRMLDITANPLVALFFACCDNKKDNTKGDSDGYVYIFKANKNNVLSYDSDRALLLSTLPKLSNDQKKSITKYLELFPEENITPDSLKKDYYAKTGSNMDKEQVLDSAIPALKKFIYECERERDAFKEHHVEKKHLSEIYYVKPQFSSLRMRLQNSLFMLFGISNDSSKNEDCFFKEKVFGNEAFRIVIPKNSKKRILAELKFVCGISFSSLFGDLESMAEENKEELYESYLKNVLKTD